MPKRMDTKQARRPFSVILLTSYLLHDQLANCVPLGQSFPCAVRWDEIALDKLCVHGPEGKAPEKTRTKKIFVDLDSSAIGGIYKGERKRSSVMESFIERRCPPIPNSVILPAQKSLRKGFFYVRIYSK